MTPLSLLIKIKSATNKQQRMNNINSSQSLTTNVISITPSIMKFLLRSLAALSLLSIATDARLRGATQLSEFDTLNESIYKLVEEGKSSAEDPKLPNIVVFMVDDLGWNQVGYHANPAGNHEIYTPSIDRHANSGIKMERGYMMQWCAPSRASFLTGTTYSFNQNVTNDLYAFDEDIGFYGGIPAHIETLPKGLKRAAQRQGKDYSASYAGKWGVGGTAWMNSPLGAGYDEARVFWGDSIDGCDGRVPEASVPGTGGSLMRWVSGYFDQADSRPSIPTEQCKLVDLVSDDFLSPEEKDIACRTQPRNPPEYIDTDLLHYSQNIIKNHNYDEKPLFHMHATQGVHLPMRYPKYYDENPHYDQPEYFKDGVEKPIPNNDDIRMKESNMMRYIDDLFDGVMQSIKDAGQWEDTIVLFTSDNGGAVFPNGQSNQNYPLRGSKRSFFDGGNRVNQFLTGGWIDAQLGKDRSNESHTYVFGLDWAPTFVSIAGGDRDDMYQDLTSQSVGNAAYGSSMWDFIAESVQGSSNRQSINKPRQVSYGTSTFFDVKEEETLKYWKTGGGQANMFVRKWTPMFPQGLDVIPDFSYLSGSPCRDEDGKPKTCCVTNVEIDPEENHPLANADCDELQAQAEELFYLSDQVCDLYPNVCLDALPGDALIPNNYEDEIYSYWSLNGGSPFTNDKGQPISLSGDVPMKCVCAEIDDDTLPSEVDAMFVTLYSPSKCVKKSNYQSIDFTQGCVGNSTCYVECSGGFYDTPRPESSLLDGYEMAGIDRSLMEYISYQEYTNGASCVAVPDIYSAMQQYLRRSGFTAWPDMYNWPYIEEAGLSTCTAKGITAIPPSVTAAAPWSINVGNSVSRAHQGSSLCAGYNNTHSWCPAYQNPLQDPIMEYAEDGSSFTFADGTIVEPILADDCEQLCPSPMSDYYTGEGDAYVGGDGPMGICAIIDGVETCV